jgi:hypothetical protein
MHIVYSNTKILEKMGNGDAVRLQKVQPSVHLLISSSADLAHG